MLPIEQRHKQPVEGLVAVDEAPHEWLYDSTDHCLRSAINVDVRAADIFPQQSAGPPERG
jgi:hypothetical protein